MFLSLTAPCASGASRDASGTCQCDSGKAGAPEPGAAGCTDICHSDACAKANGESNKVDALCEVYLDTALCTCRTGYWPDPTANAGGSCIATCVTTGCANQAFCDENEGKRP